jgi:hypothetical protein
MQLPYEEDSDFFGDENLQVYAGYCSDPKADRGSFMHGKMSSIPPVNPIFLVMKICKCMQGTVLTPKQIEEVLCMVRCHESHLSTQPS